VLGGLGHFDLITARFFGVLAVRFQFVFCFSEINKEDSSALNEIKKLKLIL